MSFKIAPLIVIALLAAAGVSISPVAGAPEGGASESLATVSKPGDFSAFERAFDVSVTGAPRACVRCDAISGPCAGMCCYSPPYYCCIASGGQCYCGCS